MIPAIGQCAAGLLFLIVGAELLTRGGAEFARRLGIPPIIIGLTIVAIGTSAPELVTTLVSTLKRERDIAIGNLLGSSVFNIFLILGVTCLVPAGGLPVTPELIRIDIPFMTLVAVICAPVFMSGREVSRLEGALFVGAYVIYLAYLVLSRT
jgi:cation:H+ antiporter